MENIDTKIYLKILTNTLLEMRYIKDEKNVIQIDNTEVYWSINSLKFFGENKIKIIDWPPNNSDLNPIENLWGFKKIGDQKYTKISQYSIFIQYRKQRQRTDKEEVTIYLFKKNKMCIDSEGKLKLTNK